MDRGAGFVESDSFVEFVTQEAQGPPERHLGE